MTSKFYCCQKLLHSHKICSASNTKDWVHTTSGETQQWQVQNLLCRALQDAAILSAEQCGNPEREAQSAASFWWGNDGGKAHSCSTAYCSTCSTCSTCSSAKPRLQVLLWCNVSCQNTLPSKIKTLNLQLQSSLRAVILHDLRLGHLPVLSTVCLISGFDVGVSSRHSQTP